MLLQYGIVYCNKRKEVAFTKPLNAGKKGNKHKKRRKEEPELFASKTNNAIPPVRLIKTRLGSQGS